MARPSHRSSQSSAPAASDAETAPAPSFTTRPLTVPSTDAPMSESLLWAPALDASTGLPELPSNPFDPSEHPNLFDDLGVHRRAYRQLMQNEGEEEKHEETQEEEEPDLVILGSIPPPSPPRRPLRATLVPHADDVTMPTIGSVGGFRRTRLSFQELAGPSSPAPMPRMLPPTRPLTVADFAGEPFRYPPTNRAPEVPPAWRRAAAAAQYAAAISSRRATPPSINSPRGHQYPSSSTRPQGLTFVPSVGVAATSAPPPQTVNSAARPPRSRSARNRPVRRNGAKTRGPVHEERRGSYVAVMSDADAIFMQKIQFDLVRRVNAQNVYLKTVLVNSLALAEASKRASKL